MTLIMILIGFILGLIVGHRLVLGYWIPRM